MLLHVITCECATSERGHNAPLTHSFHHSQCTAVSAATGLVLRLPARPWAEAATPHAVARAHAAAPQPPPPGGQRGAQTGQRRPGFCGYSPDARRHRSRSHAGSAPTSTRPSASCGSSGYRSRPGSSGGSSTRCSTRPLASAAFQPRLTARAATPGGRAGAGSLHSAGCNCHSVLDTLSIARARNRQAGVLAGGERARRTGAARHQAGRWSRSPAARRCAPAAACRGPPSAARPPAASQQA
jgi:hypothetical protein